MTTRRKSTLWISFPALLAVLLFAFGAASAEDKCDITGWERGGAYDKLFDLQERDAVKGWVREIIDITPMDGMATGVGLVVEDKKDRVKETVHVGPKGFVDFSSIGLKVGDMVKVKGAWAEIDGEDVMMAIKVKKAEDVQVKVRRTKDGFPYWEMTSEERQKELTGK